MNNDLISREELKKAFEAWKNMDDYYHDTDCDDIPLSEAYDLIDNAPTVEQPTGEWAFCESVTTQGYLKCSVCEYADFRKEHFNYCPNCGAKMKGGRRMSGKCYECKYCYTNDTLGDLYMCVNGNSANCGDYTGLCCEDECEDCVKWGEEE